MPDMKPPAHTGVVESDVQDEDRIGTSAPANDLDALLSHAPSGEVPHSGDPRTDARASLSDDALGDVSTNSPTPYPKEGY